MNRLHAPALGAGRGSQRISLEACGAAWLARCRPSAEVAAVNADGGNRLQPTRHDRAERRPTISTTSEGDASMATSQTANEKALDLKPGARGRKDNSGQEVEPDASVVADKIDELVEAKKKSEAAAEAFSKKIKAIAKEAGMNAAAVRKIVDAKAGENYEQQKRYAAQLHLLFEEIGQDD